MLPGFRFLFGAIVLCFSILVFGLGAAALFRAAHEEFASRPAWRAVPGTMLAQQNDPFAQQGDSGTVLAFLEVAPDDKEAASETSHGEIGEPGVQPSASETSAAVTEPSTSNVADAQELAPPNAPPEPSPTAASEAANNAPIASEPERMAHLESETPLAEGSAAVEGAAPPAVASEPETRIAAVNETASNIAEPSTAVSEPINVSAVAPGPIAPAPRIVALGGSTEATNVPTREKEASNQARAKAYRNFIKHRLRAQSAAKARRHLAHRARIARRAAAQRQPPTASTALPVTTAVPAMAGVPAMTNVPTAENPYRF
jgi:hypothetical protein